MCLLGRDFIKWTETFLMQIFIKWFKSAKWWVIYSWSSLRKILWKVKYGIFGDRYVKYQNILHHSQRNISLMKVKEDSFCIRQRTFYERNFYRFFKLVVSKQFSSSSVIEKLCKSIWNPFFLSEKRIKSFRIKRAHPFLNNF